MEITDISWNCNGLTLAAAYGKYDHEGACSDKSYICAWNLSKREFKENNPTSVIETDVSRNN